MSEWWDSVLNAWEKAGGGVAPVAGFESLAQILEAISQGASPANPPTGQTANAASAPGGGDLASLLGQYLGTSAGAAGSGGSAAAANGYYTPDGVWIDANSPKDTYYRMVDAIWTRLYGSHPPFSMVQTFQSMGVENTSQLDTIMMEMPSHIKNADGSRISLGAYDQIKGTANSFSDKYFGRPIPDALIQQWVNQGISSPESIELWFMNHPAKDIPKDVYGQIFDQAAGIISQTWNDLPHPDTVNSVYQQVQAATGGSTTPAKPPPAPAPTPDPPSGSKPRQMS